MVAHSRCGTTLFFLSLLVLSSHHLRSYLTAFLPASSWPEPQTLCCLQSETCDTHLLNSIESCLVSQFWQVEEYEDHCWCPNRS